MKPLRALILVGILGMTALASAAPTGPGAEDLRRDEVRLLHQVLRPIDLASNLRIFELRTGEWLRTATSDPPAARVVVVYLWNPKAPEAASELPWLREMARRVEGYHGGDVRFLFVAESVPAPDMKAFLGGLRDRAPNVPWFLDQEGSIGDTLRQAMPGAELHLPITLILDDQRAVRQAMVGSMAARRSELVSAISDLLYQIRVARGRHQ
jgi:hypothetical protein